MTKCLIAAARMGWTSAPWYLGSCPSLKLSSSQWRPHRAKTLPPLTSHRSSSSKQTILYAFVLNKVYVSMYVCMYVCMTVDDYTIAQAAICIHEHTYVVSHLMGSFFPIFFTPSFRSIEKTRRNAFEHAVLVLSKCDKIKAEVPCIIIISIVELSTREG